jgi:hypothetical protein
VVHESVLETIDSADLQVFSVWEPILRTDDESSAWKARSLVDDERVEHFWTGTRDVGHLFAPAIDLANEPAWDVYLVYPKGVEWKDAVPRPVYFQHQLGGRLPAEKRLNGEKLAAALREALDESPKGR